MPICYHCKAESPAAHYARIVENKTALYGEWDGWRMAGRFLIAPGKAGRILPSRLLGMLWQEHHARRVSGTPPPCIVLPARELFAGQA